jgi:hypothetical protein
VEVTRLNLEETHPHNLVGLARQELVQLLVQ